MASMHYGGNANSNNNVRYNNTANDRAAVLAALGGNEAGVLTNVYNRADVNMNAVVRYNNSNNDRSFILSVLGGNEATVITQH